MVFFLLTLNAKHARGNYWLMRTPGFLVLLPLCLAGRANAQSEAGEPQPAPPSSPTVKSDTTALGERNEATTNAANVPPDRSVLAVSVVAKGYEVDETAVRVAIAKELGITVSSARPNAAYWVSIEVSAGADLVATLGGDGDVLMRVVKAPASADEAPELSALLIGNLARDEAQGLLLALSPKEAPESSPAAKKNEEPLNAPVEDAPPAAPSKATRAARPARVFNFSLFHPTTTLRNSEGYTLTFETGFAYGRIGGLDGVALTLGVTRVEGTSHGAQIAAFGNINDDAVSGATIGGLFNYGRGEMRGVQVSGLFNFHGSGTGYSTAGLAIVGRGDFKGIHQTGVASVIDGEVTAAQVSGVVTYASKNVTGAQIAGVSSVSRGSVAGLQLSGIANITSQRVDGAQIAGIVNRAADVNGLQLGLVNVGADVRGLQLGLVNIADDVSGASVGLVTYSKTGRTQVVSWFGGLTPFNLGVRFNTGPIYMMPTFSYKPEPSQNVFSPGLSIGTRIPLKRVFVDLDVNYSNPSNDFKYDEHTLDLRYRGLVGLELTSQFGVFAGGGVRQRIHTPSPDAGTVTPELSAGLEIF